MEKIDMMFVIFFTVLSMMLTFTSIQYLWQIRLLKRYKGRVNAKVVGIREDFYFERIFKKNNRILFYISILYRWCYLYVGIKVGSYRRY